MARTAASMPRRYRDGEHGIRSWHRAEMRLREGLVQSCWRFNGQFAAIGHRIARVHRRFTITCSI